MSARGAGRLVVLALVLGGAAARPAHAQTLPTLTGPVDDLAHVIDATSAAELDRRIRALDATTHDAIVVVTIPSYAPYGSIEEYAVRLFEQAGIGSRSQDNGLLILLAVAERQVRIEVGYGLEPFITDGFSGETIRQAMLPAFRNGEYGAGLLAGTTRLIRRLADARGVTVPDLPPETRSSPPPVPVGLVIGLIVLLLIIALTTRRRRGRPARAPPGVAARVLVRRSGRIRRGIRRIRRRLRRPRPGRRRVRRIRRRAQRRRRRVGRVVGPRRFPACPHRCSRVTGRSTSMATGWRRQTIALTGLIAALGLVTGCSYNRFTAQEEGIKAQWAQVENQLQRRNDLIPNLVETVKGYAQQERDVFQSVADARAKMAGAGTPAEKIAAANDESGALSRLLVVVENYPDLKSNETFARLMDELAGTENRLAIERQRYNQRLQEYNTLRRKFPSNVTAKIFGFQEYPYFDAPPSAEAAPKVDFSR